MKKPLVALLPLLLFATGCPRTLEEADDDRPCQDIAQAIAYATFNCTADGDLANARYDKFLSTFQCVSSRGLSTEDHYLCSDAITRVECATVGTLGDDMGAWLALDDTCSGTVTTERDAQCDAFTDAAGQALAGKTTQCWSRLEFTQVVGAGLREGFACVHDQEPQQYDACVLDLQNSSCLNIPSTDGWISQANACAPVLQRAEPSPSQACDEVAEAMWWGAVQGCSMFGPDAERLQDAFLQAFTCEVDLLDPTHLSAHQTCLTVLRQSTCVGLSEEARLIPSFWIDAAGCERLVPR